MSGHTPGPWTPKFDESYNVIGGDGATIAQCKFISFLVRRSADEVAANARLIAAAPDLLEALKRARAIIAGGGYRFEDIDAAIAKATPNTETGGDHG